jgi:hypothetical protein
VQAAGSAAEVFSCPHPTLVLHAHLLSYTAGPSEDAITAPCYYQLSSCCTTVGWAGADAACADTSSSVRHLDTWVPQPIGWGGSTPSGRRAQNPLSTPLPGRLNSRPCSARRSVEVLHLRLLLRLDSFALRHGELWLLQSEFNAVVSQCDSGVRTVLRYCSTVHTPSLGAQQRCSLMAQGAGRDACTSHNCETRAGPDDRPLTCCGAGPGRWTPPSSPARRIKHMTLHEGCR